MADKGNQTGTGKQIAIIGMSCLFPGAPDLDTYWKNIAAGNDSVREPRVDEWDPAFYRAKDRHRFGGIYCTRGGFVTEFADFNPLEFGIMPTSVRGADPDQFLALRVAAEALRDAGYDHKTFDCDKAEIVIGRTMASGVGSINLMQHGQTVDQVIDVVRKVAPHLKADDLAAIERRLHETLEPCNAGTIPAVMPNIMAGRIAGKLGFRGRNLVLDAACASSLIAVEACMQGLSSGQSDLAIAGGIHINSVPYFFQMFCELGALSTSGTIRPFDDQADGTILGEGVGMVVLKRLEDAVRDGDRIYAVVRGIGSSSDGRNGGNLAPNVEGESLAMRRAYAMAGFSPQTVELLEAHGTGTRAGDLAEMQAVEKVFCENAESNMTGWCAIGSVKSMIGHTQAASGIAGLIKAVLCLKNKTLPPTLHVSKPNSLIDWSKSPCYLLDRAKPWNESANRVHPRRAAVSAFGFGGVNAHMVLEEYSSGAGDSARVTRTPLPSKRDEKGMIRLSLRYPSIDASALDDLPLQISHSAGVAESRPSEQPYSNSGISAAPATEEILNAYFNNMGDFHKNMLSMQEDVMLSYLKSEE